MEKCIKVNCRARPHYSNILLKSKEGEPLAYISEKRAAFYKRKKLVEIDPVKPNILTLNFEHEKHIRPKTPVINRSNRCVVCGSDEVSIHHVIPYFIRRYQSKKIKGYSSEWCVLLCEQHHLEIEKLVKPIYEKYLRMAEAEYVKSKVFDRIRCGKTLLKMIESGAVKNPLCFKKVSILIKGFYLVEDINNKINIEKINNLLRCLEKQAKIKKEKIRKKCVARFFNDIGGHETAKEKFKSCLISLNPKYLEIEPR